MAYASLAFGIIGMIGCACCKDVDHKMNNKIEVYLENTENANQEQVSLVSRRDGCSSYQANLGEYESISHSVPGSCNGNIAGNES